MSALRHARAILLLPFVVTVLVPAGLVYGFGADPLDLGASHPTLRLVLGGVGLACLLVGLGLLVATVRLFATRGDGTLAPWDPTRRLVVAGVYRNVRNPMISGVVAILVGEALVVASPAVLAWVLLFFTLNAIYIPRSEEPGLVARFGEDYETYRRHVPRWIPRLRAWELGDPAPPNPMHQHRS